jgi:hypothetical protein
MKPCSTYQTDIWQNILCIQKINSRPKIKFANNFCAKYDDFLNLQFASLRPYQSLSQRHTARHCMSARFACDFLIVFFNRYRRRLGQALDIHSVSSSVRITHNCMRVLSPDGPDQDVVCDDITMYANDHPHRRRQSID